MKQFDGHVLRFNQISIVSLIMIAFALQFAPIVFLVAAIMLLGTFEPRLALFKQLYTNLVRPALKITPQLEQDDPRPHNFAQGLGGVFMLVSSILFLFGLTTAAWVVAIIVFALAMLNLTTGICVGCFLYFQWRMLPHRFARKSV
jgi:ABC-type uncharacterized transport system permease subunit